MSQVCTNKETFNHVGAFARDLPNSKTTRVRIGLISYKRLVVIVPTSARVVLLSCVVKY